jgi:hypothetical protein
MTLAEVLVVKTVKVYDFASKKLYALVAIIAIISGCGNPPATKIHSSQPAPTVINLAEHVFAQLASRTNGARGNFVWIPDNQAVTATNLHMDASFFLRDVTNILAASQTDISKGSSYSCANYLTAISPRFCVSAAHTAARNSDAYNGRKMLWLLPSGAFYTNAAIAGFVISNADLMVCLMANTNPFFCRVLPVVTNKVPALKYGQSPQNLPLPAVLFRGGDGTPEPHTAFVLSLTSDGSSGVASYGSPVDSFVFGGYKGHDGWISGDSSSPAYVIINNEAALIGVAFEQLICVRPSGRSQFGDGGACQRRRHSDGSRHTV